MAMNGFGVLSGIPPTLLRSAFARNRGGERGARKVRKKEGGEGAGLILPVL